MTYKSFIILVAFLCVCVPCGVCDVNVNKLADAIYKAENSKKYPYGILQTYKRTSPRQACINTIKHAQRDYKGEEAGFIEFLGSRYCPVGSDTDNGTCKYWVRNVEHFYSQKQPVS